MNVETEEMKRLRQQIADLKSQWPAHTVPPGLMQQLDDLEEALEVALSQVGGSDDEGRAAPDPQL
jgi:hypothetical protein